MFTNEELKELKCALNNLIKDRLSYLNSNISKEEIEYTQNKLKYNYNLLKKILNLVK